ncbi:DUF930 domain-containing protein [Shinella zoogloeoides]|jgi:hypothetical protein|uniref:DUF930 domain-containing protein n=1 Tax=Shinella zoogloeoides TaxID=352475 RepID=A0A6N8TA89_SHIZO|nr:DUF930 domain-containing protein [Shinella zoogloeoides]MXO00202.1 DUF930 domain-containing protein [Shinella zoogloeoides]UEX82528.1 DUF930 domain-containing protein [Shinella zoogloeoides]
MDRQGTARRIALFALALAPLCASPALALDARIRGQLEKLTPEERLEQRCDMEAMDRIGGGKGGFRPDKVIAYAFGDPKLDGTTFKTKGAVFRSRGEWYRLSYKCEASDDRLEVNAFKYRIGEQVPHEDWAAHYLYD